MNSKEPKVISVNISTATFIKIVVLLLLLLFLFLIKEVLAILFAAIIFASALEPSVSWLRKRKIPRTLSILLIYLLVIIALVLVVRLLIPPIAGEMQGLYTDFPVYFEKIMNWFGEFSPYSAERGLWAGASESLRGLEAVLLQTAGNVFSGLVNFFGGVLSVLLVGVIAFYILAQDNAIKKLIWSAAPSQYQPYLLQLIDRVQKKIGRWLSGQILLCLIIGLMVYLCLILIGVKYALVLAVIAGIGEFIPFIGPILTALPAILIAWNHSAYQAFLVIGAYLLIQQIENHLIVPKVHQRTVGLHPLVTILVLLIGAKLAGVAGALLAIPVATAVGVFLGDMLGGREVKRAGLPAMPSKARQAGGGGEEAGVKEE